MKPEYCKRIMSVGVVGESEFRRGLWTLEEDTLLIQYIACHGKGQWNLLARCSGLNRTGKSCRLRWMNYLKPDIKRGNLSQQEKSTISELHSKWGNRWSKIAHHLPGRTDNEIKNYWRTRSQNQACELKQAESDRFQESVRTFCIPTVSQTNENTTRVPEHAKDEHDHCMPFPSPPRSSAFPRQCGCSSNSRLKIPEQPHQLKSPSADAINNFYKYPSETECFFSLEDLRFATMSPIGADDSALFSDWIDQEDDMTNNAWNTDELWQFQ